MELPLPWRLDFNAPQRDRRIRFEFSRGYSLPLIHAGPHRAPLPEQLPIRLDQLGEVREIPGFSGIKGGNFHLVDQRVKDLVERMDPFPHHFSPVEITRRDGSVLCDGYYKFNLGSFLDGALDVDASDVVAHEVDLPTGGSMVVYQPRLHPPKLVWRRQVVGTRAIWADSRLKHFIVVSRALHAAFEAAGVRGYVPRPCTFDDGA